MNNKYMTEMKTLLLDESLSAAQKKNIVTELGASSFHQLGRPGSHGLPSMSEQIYSPNDMSVLQHMAASVPGYHSLKSLDELLERDEMREKDGFKRKVNVGKVVKPAGGGKNKIVIVPTTMEDKFYHDNRIMDEEEGDGKAEGEESGDESTGTAEGEEGDIIGEVPLDQEGEAQGTGAGQGGGESHEVGSTAYDLGKVLTEKFNLPNLKDKGTKKSLTKFVYDLTDSNRGSGQVLDKKRTLNQIIKTNINLGRIGVDGDVNTDDLLINPRDYIYRVMSKEKDMQSQAVVFFVRDYSGSMSGKPTDLVCSQHVMIYSWLMYQYQEQVQSRFILHDTEAKEVEDFYTYHNTQVAGGTQIRSAIDLVNTIVREESLAKDNNIYVFYGSDGDDWNSDDGKFQVAFEEMFSYVNRIGITVVRSPYQRTVTVLEDFLNKHKIVSDGNDLARLDVLDEDVDDKRLVEGIKKLVS